MKISIIGAGNVGGMTALHLLREKAGEIVLVDAVKGFAQGKACDLKDSSCVFKYDYHIEGTDDISKIKDSGIIVITAGLARKPGMTREDLLNKNAQILKDICGSIKILAPRSIVIVVTNPLDLMSYLALKLTGFAQNRVFGMGVSLDAARFANLISEELKVSCADIDACVIGTHGEGMLPLPRFTLVKGVSLDKLVDENKAKELAQKTAGRGAQIVSLLGLGSAYFAPSQAIAAIVKNIVKGTKQTVGISAYVNGQYGIKDVCIGLPCRLGSEGIEGIVELDLNEQEKSALRKSANTLKEQIKLLPSFP